LLRRTLDFPYTDEEGGLLKIAPLSAASL
jgi:hypothetical protein